MKFAQLQAFRPRSRPYTIRLLPRLPAGTVNNTLVSPHLIVSPQPDNGSSLSLNIDEMSRRLILQLLEENAMNESAKHKGKQRAGMLTDGELALQNRTNQLHQSSTNLHDHKMALSMARAVLDDGVALTLAAQEENRAFADRRLAFQLAGLQPPVQERISVHQQALNLVNTVFSEEVASQLDEKDQSLLESHPNKRRCVTESSKTAREGCIHPRGWDMIRRDDHDDDEEDDDYDQYYYGYGYEDDDDDDDFACDVCSQVMREFILQCPLCELRACRRYTRNCI
ncbi:hypothetical protein BDV12DRAFT_165250 [Aspergillus spectabilis]